MKIQCLVEMEARFPVEFQSTMKWRCLTCHGHNTEVTLAKDTPVEGILDFTQVFTQDEHVRIIKTGGCSVKIHTEEVIKEQTRSCSIPTQDDKMKFLFLILFSDYPREFPQCCDILTNLLFKLNIYNACLIS